MLGSRVAATLVANALLFSLADQDAGIRDPTSHSLSRFLSLVTSSKDAQLQNIGKHHENLLLQSTSFLNIK